MVAIPTEQSPAPPKYMESPKDEVDQAAELFAKFSPKVGDMAAKSATIAGAVASMMIMPGPLAVGGVAAMVGGAVTRLTVAPVLMEGRYKSFELKVGGIMESYNAVGRLVECGPSVREAVVEWDLPRDYTQTYLGDLYVKYFVEQTKDPTVELSEVRKLAQLKVALDLDDEQLGHSLVKAAIDVYADVQWNVDWNNVEKSDSVEFQRVSKMLFLAKTVLKATGSHDEAIDYEMHRLREIFFFLPKDMSDRITVIGERFYRKAIEQLMTVDLRGVEPKYLGEVADRLCYNRNQAYYVNVEMYGEAISSMLGDDGLTQESFARLDQLAYIFGMADLVAKEEIDKITVPAFEEKVIASLYPLEDAEATAATLSSALRSFRVDEDFFQGVYLDAAKSYFQVKLIEVTGAASFEDASDMAKRISIMIDTKDKTLLVLNLMGMTTFMDELDRQLRDMLRAIEPKERAEIFGNALAHVAAQAEQQGMDELSTTEISAIKDNLNLYDDDVVEEYTRFADPATDRIVDQMLAGDMDMDVWAGYQSTFLKWIAVVAYPPGLLAKYAANKYAAELDRLTKSATHLYSSEDKVRLDALRGFFRLPPNHKVLDRHTHEKCGPVYQELVAQAVAQSPDGVLPQEYVDKLAAFRQRLGLPDRSAKDGMRNTAAQYMKDIVNDVIKAYGDKTGGAAADQQKKEGGVDEGQDMYVKADGTDLGFAAGRRGPSAQAQAALQQGSATSEMLEGVTKVVKFWEGNHLEDDPITMGASFMSARHVHLRTKEELYKGCVYEFIKCADPVKRDVYRTALHKFPTCIELPGWQAARIRREVGEDVVLSYSNHALGNKPSLDANDGLFVTTLSEELKVDLSDVPQRAKSNFLNDKIEAITGLDDYEAVAEIKEAAIAMGTDLSHANANIPIEIARHMFDIEVKHLFEIEMEEAEGALNDDELIQEAIVELADVYGQNDDAEKLVAQILGDLASTTLQDAQWKSTQFRTAEASRVLDRLLKFTAFIDIETLKKHMNLVLIHPNSPSNLKLITPYQLRGDVVKDDLAVLKEILQIDEDPQNPTREDWIQLQEIKDTPEKKSVKIEGDAEEELDDDDYMKDEIEANKEWDPDEDVTYG